MWIYAPPSDRRPTFARKPVRPETTATGCNGHCVHWRWPTWPRWPETIPSRTCSVCASRPLLLFRTNCSRSCNGRIRRTSNGRTLLPSASIRVEWRMRTRSWRGCSSPIRYKLRQVRRGSISTLLVARFDNENPALLGFIKSISLHTSNDKYLKTVRKQKKDTNRIVILIQCAQI